MPTPPELDAAVTPLARLRRFCESPRRVGLVIVALSLALRVGLFVELSSGPCLQLHRWSGGDMYRYDRWARRIVAGDWLSREWSWPIPRALVHGYLSAHPDEAAALAGARDPEKTLWKRWMGAGEGFYTDPLYPYLVALTYLVTGPDPRDVFVWQMGLGIGINLLVLLLSRRCFGPVAGAVAGLMVTLYAPLLYYELLLLREVSITFVALTLAYLTLRAVASTRTAWWGALGIGFGLAFLLKSTFLLEALGLAGGAALATWRRCTTKWKPFAAGALGVALGLSPLVARNVAVGAPLLALAGNGPITFISGNAAGQVPERGYVQSDRLVEILGATGGRFLPAALATLRTHDGVGSFLRQLGSKVEATLNWYEIPNNTNFYYFRLHAAVLRWLPVTFFLVGPLGLVGLALAVRRWRDCWAAYVLVATAFVPLLLFLTLSRLRLPMAVGLIPFAAFAAARIGGWALARTRADALRAGVTAACALLLLAWTGSGHAAAEERIRMVDYSVPLDVFYGPAVDEAERRGDRARGVEVLEAYLRTEPPVLATLGPDHPARGEWQKHAASFFATVRDVHADKLAAAGRAADAEAERRRVADLRGALR